MFMVDKNYDTLNVITYNNNSNIKIHFEDYFDFCIFLNYLLKKELCILNIIYSKEILFSYYFLILKD